MKIEQMKHELLFLLLLLLLGACTDDDRTPSPSEQFLTQDIPINTPKPFLPVGIFDGLITHQGVFSPDYQTYYFTVSDPGFRQFTVKQITKEETKWSEPSNAFFNSNFNEHGISVSRDGNTLFFSSTRPVSNQEVADTWHLWKVERVDGHWGDPTYIDIPNLNDKLTSHPSIALDGTLYFHSSNLDYSEMGIYVAERTVEGYYQPAKKLEIPGLGKMETCTPYIDPNEKFILFALIGEQLELALSRRLPAGDWSSLQKLPTMLNTKGQGNPQLSPDGKYLFYAVGDYAKGEGHIQWIELAAAFASINL